MQKKHRIPTRSTFKGQDQFQAVVDIIQQPSAPKRSLSEERLDKERDTRLFSNLFESKEEEKAAEHIAGGNKEIDHFPASHTCSSPKSENFAGLQKHRLELIFQHQERPELTNSQTEQTNDSRKLKKNPVQTTEANHMLQKEESSVLKSSKISKPAAGKNLKSDEGTKPNQLKQANQDCRVTKGGARSKKSSSERQASEKEKSIQQMQETVSANQPGETHGSSQGRSSAKFKDIPTLLADSRYVAEHGITNLTMDHETWPREAVRTNSAANPDSTQAVFSSQDIKQLMEEDIKSIARKFLKKTAKEFIKMYDISPSIAESISKQLQERIEKALLGDQDISSSEETFKKNYTFKLAELVTLVKVRFV